MEERLMYEKGEEFQLASGNKIRFKKDVSFTVFHDDVFYRIQDARFCADVFCESFEKVHKYLMLDLEFLYFSYAVTTHPLTPKGESVRKAILKHYTIEKA